MENSSYTGADLFVDILEEYGVTHVFGNPGTTELPVIQAIAESNIEYVLGLHEDIAVGMASGYASTLRYYGDEDTIPVGVVNLHVLPGLAHGLGNLYGAQMAGVPLVVTAGNHSTDYRHHEPILSGDLVNLAQQFTKWSAEVLDVSAFPTMLRRAFRIALTPPTGPVFLSLPLDVTLAETDEWPERLGAIPELGLGDYQQIEHAADLLIDADNPVFIIGDQVARSGEGAVETAVRLAEVSGARVYGEYYTGEIGFPTEHDLWASFIPIDEALTKAVLDTDTLVFIGCSTNTTATKYEGNLIERDTVCIHISNDVWEVGKNALTDATVLGNIECSLIEIAAIVDDNLSQEERSSRVERSKATVREIRSSMIARTENNNEHNNRPSKADLVDTLQAIVSDPYIVDESVTSKYVLLNRWSLDHKQYIGNKSGGLGYGLPATIGAAIAARETDAPITVLGFIGDGSYLYYPHAIYTAAHKDINFTVVIPNNQSYQILKEGTAAMLGGNVSDYSFVGMDFQPSISFTDNAESYSVKGYRIETTDELEQRLKQAINDDEPSVVDILVQD
ncbi:thiamine pyrophosphate-binding protein [Halocatena halophila]|uniref:thiamine pyrophosphate-binding protein n=1 Tax=Halocatena halophila TaxID=2814576 RepID=UPI002ED0C23A